MGHASMGIRCASEALAVTQCAYGHVSTGLLHPKRCRSHTCSPCMQAHPGSSLVADSGALCDM
eukprot:1675156-Alexandrium_andersonii.AAC.1